MEQKDQKKLSAKETKELLPILREFNKISKSFIGLLKQKVEIKEEQVSTIKVWVSDIKIPKQNESNINIQTLDIRNTVVRERGKGMFTKEMDWEDDLKQKRRGIVL